MKTKSSMAPRPGHLSQNEWYAKIEKISSECKSVEVFEFGGSYFSGSIVGTAKAYLQENPAKGFFEWLVDNGLEIKQVEHENS